MNITAIKLASKIQWSVEDDCFIVTSPLIDSVIGVGNSEEEAVTEFNNILDDAFDAYQAGELRF